MKAFFLVLARDENHIDTKIEELRNAGIPYLVVCGSRLNRENVVYRKAKGKYDAINFGLRLVPKDIDVVALNDVDTKINNLQAAFRRFQSSGAALLFAKVSVNAGPQRFFYVILDFIRRRVPIVASGELMLINRHVLEKILPLMPCKAEDTFILFKFLEFGYPTVFCEECCAQTSRTDVAEEEEAYKRRSVTGIYQALSYANPPLQIRLFYTVLPLFSPLLLILGKKGHFWMKGILLGLIDYIRGDRTGTWETTYE